MTNPPDPTTDALPDGGTDATTQQVGQDPTAAHVPEPAGGVRGADQVDAFDSSPGRLDPARRRPLARRRYSPAASCSKSPPANFTRDSSIPRLAAICRTSSVVLTS